MSAKLIFMGADAIALPALEAVASGRCGDVDIVAVYTQPDRARGRGKKVVPNAIKIWALERGIEVRQPEKLKKAERLEIEAMGVDAILVMAYGHMLSQKLIDTPRCGILNLHTSLLPKYRGASPIQCATASGDLETGVSLIQMVREMDAGPVIDVEKVSIERLDTALDVEHSLSEACVPLLERNLPKVLAGESSVVEQDSDAATYVRKLGKEDGDLDFRVSAEVLAKRVNALFPWPGTRLSIGDVSIKLGLADWEEADSGKAPGTVLDTGKSGVKVACASGVAVFKKLQRPGAKMLEADDFCRGFEIGVGTVIESREMSRLVQ
ncbi:MAG: methionyl-tRNA formyltransferase [Verrucomicrobiota bacterium]